jgi:hypothetical protein
MDPNSLVGRAQGTLGNTISGQYLNPSTNPYLAGSVNDALGQVQSKFAGLYGGAAGANVNNSGYQEQLARTLAQTALPAYANAYQQERQNQLSATQMAPSLDYAQSNALGQVGAQQQQAPWAQLQNYQGALTGNFGGQGTQQSPYFQNPLANAMGLGLGGMGIYGMGQKAGLWGGAAPAAAGLAGLDAIGTMGTMAGIGGMGLEGALMFSDRRLKSNIVKVGDHPRGFAIYEYDIFGRRERGVMADEVEKVIPDAVHDIGGYQAVDYSMLRE